MEVNKIYQGDCLELFKQLDNSSVDCIITDPPYLINYRSNRRVVKEKFNHIQNDKDNNKLIADFLVQARRVLKDGTAIYCFCSWHNIEFFKQEFEKNFNLKNIIIWVKNNHGTGDLKGSYAPKYEMILFGHKGRAFNQNGRKPDVIECAKINSSELTHPTEKPIELLKTFILNNSKEGDIILDCFAGTGSTLLASKELNRKFVGFELEKEYFDIALRRLQGGGGNSSQP